VLRLAIVPKPIGIAAVSASAITTSSGLTFQASATICANIVGTRVGPEGARQCASTLTARSASSRACPQADDDLRADRRRRLEGQPRGCRNRACRHPRRSRSALARWRAAAPSPSRRRYITPANGARQGPRNRCTCWSAPRPISNCARAASAWSGCRVRPSARPHRPGRAPGLGSRPPPGVAAGLEETYYWEPPTVTWSYAVHVAIVEVDRETGAVLIEKYVIAHDCGVVVNRCWSKGRSWGHGAGAGGILCEAIVYDDAGQLLSGSLMDYALPKASDLPALEVIHQQSPSPLNPLGVKGSAKAARWRRRRRSPTPCATPLAGPGAGSN